MSAPAVIEGTVDGRACVELCGADGLLRAVFLPSLGMVCCSLLHSGAELLAQQGGVDAYAERGSTFALPLLHPYANRLSGWSYSVAGRRVEIPRDSAVVHRDGSTGLPIHGLLAASPFWELAGHGVDGEAAWLRGLFDFGARPELLAVFPFPHRLELLATVAGARLSVRVTLSATGEVPVPVSFGFHPYLTLPGSARETWEVELPVRRRSLLDERGIPTGEQELLEPGALSGPLGTRTFDDAFDRLVSPGPVEFSVADGRRRVAVEFREGYPVAQVFAPEGSGFICFEPMTAPVDALRSGAGLQVVEPGASFGAEFVVSVTSSGLG
jgi:aldose 1-epimerase